MVGLGGGEIVPHELQTELDIRSNRHSRENICSFFWGSCDGDTSNIVRAMIFETLGFANVAFLVFLLSHRASRESEN